MVEKEFVNGQNIAVFTTKYVLDDSSPILYACHYEEDGAWEFLGAEKEISDEDYRIVSLEEIIDMDSSVLKIISMKTGYYASRESRYVEWMINKML